MEFRIIQLPSFKAASSGLSQDMDFSENSVLGKFDAYISSQQPSPRDSFTPRDFLYYDSDKKGMVWLYALSEDMTSQQHEVVDFTGGYYLAYTYRDGDDEAEKRLYKEAMVYLETSPVLMPDTHTNRFIMGRVTTPQEIIDAQGWSQMETLIPIKLK